MKAIMRNLGGLLFKVFLHEGSHHILATKDVVHATYVELHGLFLLFPVAFEQDIVCGSVGFYRVEENLAQVFFILLDFNKIFEHFKFSILDDVYLISSITLFEQNSISIDRLYFQSVRYFSKSCLC